MKLAATIGSTHPELKILQLVAPSSGFVNQGLPGRNADFLRKPFLPAALARKLRLLLDRQPQIL